MQLTGVPLHYETLHAVTCFYPYPAEHVYSMCSLSAQGGPISGSGAVPLQTGGLLDLPLDSESSKMPVIAPFVLSVGRVLSTVYGTDSESYIREGVILLI